MMRFGTSGIRGLFNEELNLRWGRKLCSALSQNFSGGIALGYDARQSSRVLADYMLAGLSYYGRNVTSFGVIPTPVLAFITKEEEFDAGLVLTASHNPPEYAGIKVFDSEGIEIDNSMEKRIECSVKGNVEMSRSVKEGKVSYYSAASLVYSKKIMGTLPSTKRKLKILVDSGNGATAKYTAKILGNFGHKVVTVNSHQSRCSYGRESEPNVHTLRETAKLVKVTRSDIGIAHDGDGDRTVLIDERGRIVKDQVFSSLAIIILLKNIRNGTIVLSSNTSYSVEQLAEKMGYKVKRAKLGKTFLEMKRLGGVLATEPSKVTDASWGVWEDGIYTAVNVVQYLSNSSSNLSDICVKVPTNFYYQKNLLLKGIKQELLKKKVLEKYSGERIEDIDGLKIIFDDNSFSLFRVSGTEPKVRIYTDSSSNSKAAKLLSEGIKIVKDATK